MLQPAKTQPGKGVNRAAVVIVAIVAIGCMAGAYATVSSLVSSGGRPSSDRSLEATDMCETFVKQQLKAPATAKFSEESSAKVSDSEYTAGGFVDSQNSFGALLRSTFVCDLTIDVASNTWTSKSVSVAPTS